MSEMEDALGLKNKEDELLKRVRKLKREIWFRSIAMVFRYVIFGIGLAAAVRGMTAYAEGDTEMSTYELLIAILMLQRWGL